MTRLQAVALLLLAGCSSSSAEGGVNVRTTFDFPRTVDIPQMGFTREGVRVALGVLTIQNASSAPILCFRRAVALQMTDSVGKVFGVTHASDYFRPNAPDDFVRIPPAGNASFPLEVKVSHRLGDKIILWGRELSGWWQINDLKFGKYRVSAVYEVEQRPETFDVKALPPDQRQSLYRGPLESPSVNCLLEPKHGNETTERGETPQMNDICPSSSGSSSSAEKMAAGSGGISCDLKVDPKVWVSPALRKTTAITFILALKNLTEKQTRPMNWESVTPLLMTEAGKAVKEIDGSNPKPYLRNWNYPVAHPGEVMTMRTTGYLGWEDGRLTFSFWDGGFVHYFYDVKPGKYKIALRYSVFSPPPEDGARTGDYTRQTLSGPLKKLLLCEATTAVTEIEIR